MSAASVLTSLRPLEISEILSPFSDKCSYLNDDDFRVLMEHLTHAPFPGIKDEEYRYFPIETFIRKAVQGKKNTPQPHPEISDLPSHPHAYNLYILNGKLLSHSEIPRQFIKCSTFRELAEKYPLHALNELTRKPDVFQILSLLYPSSGLGLYVHSTPDKPLCVWHLCQSNAIGGINISTTFTRLEKNTTVRLLEYFINTNDENAPPVFFIHFHEKQISENASLRNYIIQNLSPNHFLHSSSFHSVKNSGFSSQHIFSLHGEMIRNNHSILLLEPGSKCEMYGLTSGKKKNIIDHHTSIRHCCHSAESYELYKGIAYDESTLIFNGKIKVDPLAQKTNSFQNSRFILMGSQASIHAKPQLEIFANDVKCSHGSATGRPDDAALFYMQSRGIRKQKALELWAQGFFSELISRVDDEYTRNYVEQYLQY